MTSAVPLPTLAVRGGGAMGSATYGYGATGNRIPTFNYVRHGSDERRFIPRTSRSQGAPRRERSRESPDPLSGRARDIRSGPAGPVERQ